MDPEELDPDPISQFRSWFDEAVAVAPNAAAMTLATSSASGAPSARTVLLRGIDERGFTFFTNRRSRKAEELAENPRAALVFHWWDIGRQVRVEGKAEEVSGAEAEEYWQRRPRASQVAAWASSQSAPLASRAALDAAVADAEQRFSGRGVPLPPFWGGYRIAPTVVEFWAHRENRLHDRVRYTRTSDGWTRERLAP